MTIMSDMQPRSLPSNPNMHRSERLQGQKIRRTNEIDTTSKAELHISNERTDIYSYQTTVYQRINIIQVLSEDGAYQAESVHNFEY